MSTKNKKLFAGNLKDYDGGPVKVGESIFSEVLWNKLKVIEVMEANLKLN